MKGKGLKGLSRVLRKNQTDAERKLWACLRAGRFEGVKFRRQVPLGPYIADYCSLEEKLIIELDGGQHAERQEQDKERTKYLEEKGFRVIRVWNNDIFSNMEGVLGHIRTTLRTAPSPRPSPLKGEGGKRSKS